MSTIYTDAAGNKYLGDCRWGNHDVNYPTTDWLKPQDIQASGSVFRQYLSDLLIDYGYTNVLFDSNWADSSLGATYSSRFISGNIPIGEAFYLGQTKSWLENSARVNASFGGTLSTRYVSGFLSSLISSTNNLNYYTAICNDNGFSFTTFTRNTSNQIGNKSTVVLTKLADVNQNFNYYSSSVQNHSVFLYLNAGFGTSFGDFEYMGVAAHFVQEQKYLLQTGRAAYAISCSDGQTPGAQWATDMWVYDNNATLGYPVIGRVPNMLLGIGDYTYLKPVKIGGSVFPDNGSPWYLPVGTFSGKVLLMRCYSSVA